jgi:hypothetical protein
MRGIMWGNAVGDVRTTEQPLAIQNVDPTPGFRSGKQNTVTVSKEPIVQTISRIRLVLCLGDHDIKAETWVLASDNLDRGLRISEPGFQQDTREHECTNWRCKNRTERNTSPGAMGMKIQRVVRAS